jgi:hypothetical protein
VYSEKAFKKELVKNSGEGIVKETPEEDIHCILSS